MSVSLKLLANIDQRTKYTVYGWIRQAEKELQLEQMPAEEIGSICILYYRDGEIFDGVGSGVIVSENKKKITQTGSRDGESGVHCSYGMIEIPTNCDSICRWDLKIHKHNNHGGIRIGICTAKIMGKFWDIVKANESVKHALCLYSSYASKYDPLGEHQFAWPGYGKKYTENDVVSIILDLKKRTINYLVNDKDQGIAYKDIELDDETKYQLIVALGSIQDCVEIICFSRS